MTAAESPAGSGRVRHPVEHRLEKIINRVGGDFAPPTRFCDGSHISRHSRSMYLANKCPFVQARWPLVGLIAHITAGKAPLYGAGLRLIGECI